jgi:hypothetical protein
MAVQDLNNSQRGLGQDGGVLGCAHQGPRSSGPPQQRRGVWRQRHNSNREQCYITLVNIFTDARYSIAMRSIPRLQLLHDVASSHSR